MAERVSFTRTAPRAEIYAELTPQIEALIRGETDVIANLANVAAVLKEAFAFFWVGFYIEKEGDLVLGPFQGPIACTRIKPERGVCGFAYSKKETVVVPDVEKFPGHIACSSNAKSEIVVPIFNGERVFGVLDVDSDLPEDFTAADKTGLETIVKIIEQTLNE
ncbi:MAG: GAF domain-containing protein [Pyrinomonadaceae bacterium]